MLWGDKHEMTFGFCRFAMVCRLPVRYIDGSGAQRVQGGSDLKKSQHYPPRFGMAICEVFLQHYPDIKNAVKANTKTVLANPVARELKDRT